jgi:hypothetical protein
MPLSEEMNKELEKEMVCKQIAQILFENIKEKYPDTVMTFLETVGDAENLVARFSSEEFKFLTAMKPFLAIELEERGYEDGIHECLSILLDSIEEVREKNS